MEGAEIPFSHPRAGLALLLACLAIGACSDRPDRRDVHVPEAVLAPRLLRDTEDTQRFVAAFPRDEYEIVEVPGLGRFYVDDNPAWVKRTLRAGRIWEPEVQEVMMVRATPGSTALDVGAHIGSHTVALARAVGPTGVVYAFEPQRKIYRELVENLGLNGIENGIPLRYAVGSEVDVIEMSPAPRHDGRTTVGTGGDRVEMRTLDSFSFSNVSLIKIDVEGYELYALEGAEETIRAWRPAIIVEIMGENRYDRLPPEERARVDAVKAFFGRHRYTLEFIGSGGEPNFLALPSDASR